MPGLHRSCIWVLSGLKGCTHFILVGLFCAQAKAAAVNRYCVPGGTQPIDIFSPSAVHASTRACPDCVHTYTYMPWEVRCGAGLGVPTCPLGPPPEMGAVQKLKNETSAGTPPILQSRKGTSSKEGDDLIKLKLNPVQSPDLQPRSQNCTANKSSSLDHGGTDDTVSLV